MVQLGVVTIVGYVGSEPTIFDKAKGAICSFRLGCTRGYYDAAHVWQSFPTTWVTVKTFRRLAEHVHRSVRKGDPVIVTGQLNTEIWVQDNAERSRMVVEASSVGHDLNCGNAMFYKEDKSSRSVQHNGDSGERPSESVGGVDLFAAPQTASEVHSDVETSGDAVGTTAVMEGAGQPAPDIEQEEFAGSGF